MSQPVWQIMQKKLCWYRDQISMYDYDIRNLRDQYRRAETPQLRMDRERWLTTLKNTYDDLVAQLGARENDYISRKFALDECVIQIGLHEFNRLATFITANFKQKQKLNILSPLMIKMWVDNLEPPDGLLEKKYYPLVFESPRNGLFVGCCVCCGEPITTRHMALHMIVKLHDNDNSHIAHVNCRTVYEYICQKTCWGLPFCPGAFTALPLCGCQEWKEEPKYPVTVCFGKRISDEESSLPRLEERLAKAEETNIDLTTVFDDCAGQASTIILQEEQPKKCLCGSDEEMGTMIQCETCEVWFHEKCLGFSDCNKKSHHGTCLVFENGIHTGKVADWTFKCSRCTEDLKPYFHSNKHKRVKRSS